MHWIYLPFRVIIVFSSNKQNLFILSLVWFNETGWFKDIKNAIKLAHVTWQSVWPNLSKFGPPLIGLDSRLTKHPKQICCKGSLRLVANLLLPAIVAVHCSKNIKIPIIHSNLPLQQLLQPGLVWTRLKYLESTFYVI